MKHKERGNTHMAKEQLIFCGSSETFLDKALTADSNGGQRRKRLSYSKFS